jgi:cell division septal protein FtsQ
LAKSRLKKTEPAPPPRRLTRWLVQCGVLLVVVAGFVAGIIYLGRLALEQLPGQERYLVPVAEIECAPPVGLPKKEFLEQVQYEARLPERLNVLDENLPRALRDAFVKHPWVERVDEVTLTAPRRIEVRLTYRRPVLAVAWEDGLRALDGFGVLLPKNAPTRGLPVYEGQPSPPKGPAGTRWGDPNLEQEARRRGKEPK